MAGDWPITDSRRASALRDALARMVPALAPDWAGLDQEGDFGRALVEIAARLAEHSTSRLDRTALRDKLAFLDALDVATPPPRSATVPIVFTLAEKRLEPVFAPARVRLTAEKGDEEISFETREAIDLTPARLTQLLAADPAADRIERAPAVVTGALDAAVPPTRYLLLSAVEAGGTALQLVQAVGIEPGDLLRLGTIVYRVEKTDGAIVHLKDPLETSAPAQATVEKLVRLEAFGLRNLQEHAAYFGHKEMLKLDGPAVITLVFDPPSLPTRLAGLDLEYQLWGTPKDADAPGWQELHLLGAGPDGLRLSKSWEGPVEELEVAGAKSRWLRLRLRSPIAGAGGPATSTVSVELKVRSAAPAGAGGEGSQSIAAAFYNSLPLPTSGAFFPFGPEPQRFDIFSLSAPEALSKKGATVTITVKLNDASLNAMTYAIDAPDHVYGVSASGRLQSVRFDAPKPADWRQLGLAPPGAAAGPPGGEGTLRLDGGAPLYAIRGPGGDRVFVRDADELIRMVRVEWILGKPKISEWQSLPAPSDDPFLGFCLIPWEGSIFFGAPVLGWLLAAGSDGFYAQAVNPAGSPSGTWFPMQSSLTPTGPIALALASSSYYFAEIALIDGDGQIHHGQVDLVNARITWTAFNNVAPANPAIRPAAWLDGVKLTVIAARIAAAVTDDPVLLVDKDGELPAPRSDLRARLGDARSIAILPGAPGAAPELVAVTGTRGIMLWAGTDAEVAELPADVDPASPHALLLPPATPAAPPTLLINAGSELLLQESILMGSQNVVATLRDMVRHDPARSTPTHVTIDNDVAPRVLEGPWLTAGAELVRAAPLNMLAPGDDYELLEDLQQSFSGSRGGLSKTLVLGATDAVTSLGDIVRIGNKLFWVTQAPVAGVTEVHRALPGGNFSYSLYRLTEPQTGTFTTADRKRLAKLDIVAPPGAGKLRFPAPADPRPQFVADAQADWLLLDEKWDTDPQTSAATLIQRPQLDDPMQIRLPRESDNPDLSWEYFDGESWQRLDGRAAWEFEDQTGNLARSGDIVFKVPGDLTQAETAGKEDYWLRARLVGGDFGRASYVVENDPPSGSPSRTSITIDRSRLNPPEILSIEARYELTDPVPPDRVVADNNLAAIDQTQAARADGALFNLFEGVARHVSDAGGGSRAFYLGFARSPDVAALNLYADAVDKDDPPRTLLAEVLTPDGWQKIASDDDTKGLTRPGLLRLFLSPAPAQLPLFGQDGWWLRLRPGEGMAAWAPVLRGLHVNAVIAEHAKSMSQEILGSSLGEPDQSYWLAQTPVLPATLELRVREALGAEERESILKQAGVEAIADDNPDLPGEWVRWQQVDTFIDEDGDSRTYRLDPATGEIRFGNGRCGKIPPAGRDAIRAFGYQAGGGSTGNVSAREVKQLASAIESVELAINPVDAAGGADPPRAERLAETAPALLRLAGKALAPADIEALATESAPDVARARCLPHRGCGIRLAVAIAGTDARCPVPSRARREGIAGNLREAGWGALAPDAIEVVPPRYVHVTVTLTLAATSADAVARLDRDARAALTALLHPIEGGPDRRGWPFGRRVWPSDIQRAIAGLSGLDKVVGLELAARDAGDSLDAMPDDGLICAEEDDIEILVAPPGESP